MNADTPKRIQMPPRHQRKGWRKPDNSKIVTRASRWGNPYRTIKDGGPYTVEESLANYRRDLFSDQGVQARPGLPPVTVKDVMDQLRGLDLICGCDLDDPCHADLLLPVANIPWSGAPADPRMSADLIASCFHEDRNWGQNFHVYIEALHKQEPMEPAPYHYSLGIATFCGAHGLIPGFERKLNWFGYGDLPVAFEAQNDDEPLKTMFWAEDLAKVSGVDVKRLHEFWQEERGDDRSDVYALTYYSPERNTERTLPLFSHSMAMRVMSFLSPWSQEFYKATEQMMAHAMTRSGLGQSLFGGSESGFTAIAHMKGGDGETIKLLMPVHDFGADSIPIVRAPWDDAPADELVPITDLCEHYELQRAGDAVHDFLGPKVSEEEAAEMAFRGPAGAMPAD